MLVILSLFELTSQVVSAPAVVLPFLLFFLPESPRFDGMIESPRLPSSNLSTPHFCPTTLRWLLAKGRISEARWNNQKI